MANVRHDRVSELLKRQLGEIIRREFNVNDCGLISVNDLSLGGDLRSATVFISILGNADQKRHGLEQLQQHRIRIQGLVGKAVVLKYTPTLRFLFDDSVVRGNRVLQLIEEIEKNNPAPPATQSPAPLPSKDEEQ